MMDLKTKFRDQSGAALVVALVMIIVLTLIGLASTFTSTFEISLSGNKRYSTDAFYDAETWNTRGARSAPAIDDQGRADPSASPFTCTTLPSDGSALSQDEKDSGLEGEYINRRTVINKGQLVALPLPSGKTLNDNATVKIYHTLPSAGQGQGGMKPNTYIIDALGTDQVISSNQHKSTIHIRTKVVVLKPTEDESQ